MKTLLERLKDYEAELVAELEKVRGHISKASENAQTSQQDTTGGSGGDQPPTGPGIPS